MTQMFVSSDMSTGVSKYEEEMNVIDGFLGLKYLTTEISVSPSHIWRSVQTRVLGFCRGGFVL